MYSQTNSPALIQKLINQDSGQPQNVDFSLFWEAWNTLEKKYVDKSKLDTQKMVYGAIEGMVSAVGDPYTVFFEPVTSNKFQEEISGSFGGVGMELGMRDELLTVISPLKNTPAFRAGIQAGDRISKIEGVSTVGVKIEDAISKIRGKAGTRVTITITDNKNISRDVTLTREVINVPTVEWKIIESKGKRAAYVQIFSFNQKVDSQFDKAAKEIAASNADALIIDLRNNPGGLLDSAINLAGYFLNDGQVVVSEIFGDGSRNQFTADGNTTLQKLPTIILLNGGSASASEILAGALHDNLNIKIVGEKTFGKGSVQQLETFNDGSSLKVTVAKWYTPDGISISDKGIEPDVKAELSEDQRSSVTFGDPDQDPQLQKVLDILY